MTRKQHEIRRSILRKIREHLAVEREAIKRTLLLGVEAGHLLQVDTPKSRSELGRNLEEAEQLGVRIDPEFKKERTS